MAFNEFLIGKRERMSWIVETSFGSGGTMSSGEVVGLNCSVTPDFSQGWQEVLSAGADTREVEERVKGGKYLPYTMDFVPVNWRWLKYLMTVVDSTDGATKTHNFTINNSITSYKLEWAKRHTTDHVITLIGNVIPSVTISWAKATGEGTEGFLKISAKCFGQDDSQGSSDTTLNPLTKTPVQYRMVKLKLNGTEVVEVNNGELTIDQGIADEDSRYCNSTLDTKVGEPIPKVFRVTGRINVNIKDKTYYDLWAARAIVGTELATGTASSGGNTTLVDTGIGWTPDAYIGDTVTITSGTGVGQTRTISDNTTDTLTVTDAWTTNPASASVYTINEPNSLLFDKDATGNDQMLFTFAEFILLGGVAPTSLDGVTNVDLVFSARLSSAISRDDIATY